MVFNAFLFLAGVGGIFFRMARDNDDLVRMALVLVAGSGATLIYAGRRVRPPSSLLIPCLAFSLAMLLSSFLTVNPPESLKEFAKIGVYMLVFLALASSGTQRSGPRLSSRALAIAAALLLLGLMTGYIHAHSPAWRDTFRLWSTPQVSCSIASSLLFCMGICILLSPGNIRQGLIRGLMLQAIIACAIGILQFYGFDPLRPWDPRQPYSSYLRGNPDFLRMLAGLTGGALKLEGDSLVLELNRILGIYGNPDFFAPFLLQFVPLFVATSVLDPVRRTSSLVLTGLLLTTMVLTNVRGALIGMIVLAPFFGMVLGAVTDRQTWSEARAGLTKPLIASGIALAFLLLIGVFLIEPGTRLYMGLVYVYVAYLHGGLFYVLTRVKRDHVRVLGIGAMLLIALYVGAFVAVRHFSGIRIGAIEERLVKYRLAAEMWEREPLTGVGLNAYKSWYPELQQRVRMAHGWKFEDLGSSGTQENRTHNDIAQLLAETGVLGTGMFLWLIASLIFAALARMRNWRGLSGPDRANMCGLLGGVMAILVYMLPNFPLHIISSAGTFWIIAGLLASYLVGGAGHGRRDAKSTTDCPQGLGEPLSPRIARPLALAAAMMIAASAIHSFRLLAGTILYKRADFLSRQAQPPRPMQALPNYEKALQLDPSNAQYHYDFGAMCFNASTQDPDRYPELAERARELLLTAKARGFLSEDLTYGLGHLAENAGNREEAYYWYSYAAGLRERHPHARQGRIRILRAELGKAEEANGRGDFVKARALFEEAYRANADNWLAALYLGTLDLATFGKTERGLEYLRAAVRMAPNEPSVQLAYAKGLASASEFAQARKALLLAAALEPGNAEVKSALRRLETVSSGGATAIPAPAAR